MGLKIGFYKTNKKNIQIIIKDKDFKRFDEIDMPSRMITNYFGIGPTNKNFAKAIKKFYSIGLLAHDEFWIDQTVIEAGSHAMFHSSYISYNNPEHTELLKDRGFIIITEQQLKNKELRTVMPHITIPENESWTGDEIIDEILRSINKA